MKDLDLKQLAKNGGQRYLSFSLGHEEFAIPLLVVKEVIAVPSLTSMPYAPKHFLGIMNLRGIIIPVVDLGKKLDVTTKAKQAETAVIICDFGSTGIGIKVDSVNSVVAPAASELSERPDSQTGNRSDFVFAIYRKEKSLVLLLDVGKILDAADRQSIEQSIGMKKAS